MVDGGQYAYQGAGVRNQGKATVAPGSVTGQAVTDYLHHRAADHAQEQAEDPMDRQSAPRPTAVSLQHLRMPVQVHAVHDHRRAEDQQATTDCQ